MVSSVSRKEDKLVIETDDFPGNQMSLSYYRYTTLIDCYYKFYLEKLVRLAEDRVVVDREMSPLLFGNFVHEVFAEVLNRQGRNLNVSKEVVEEVIVDKLNSYRLQINNYYLPYYRKVLLPTVRDSVISFFRGLKRRVKGEIVDIKIEWQPEKSKDRVIFNHDFTDVFLNGRVDLIIETSDTRFIIDFKTGQGKEDQLDFYSLLLAPDYGSEKKVAKELYNVMKASFKAGAPGTEEEFAREISEEIKNFFEGGEYTTIYKSRCKDCNWMDICRVVIE